MAVAAVRSWPSLTAAIGDAISAASAGRPACSSTWSSSRPIVPAPMITTGSPNTGPRRRMPCTAHASGSAIAPYWVPTWSGRRYALTAGTATNSANAPSTVSPIAAQFSHRLSRPARHRRQYPQYSEGSTATRAPIGRSGLTSGPRATIVPANSWPGVMG